MLEALNKGDSVLIEKESLDEFWKFCMSQKDYYSFRYEYTEFHVKITQTPDTILRVKSHEIY